MEAVKGCTKPVTLRIQDMCGRCSGTGAEPGKKPQTCPYCQGKGEVSVADGRGGGEVSERGCVALVLFFF